ncbi:fimbrial biogenesis chaperone [Halioxenophilus aromaticivorans]|uniref:Pili assembly chaperone N-terminal domain-containing protein n=1 Tax=Halioxenophilus aromaticivorans TaxID=1306992 RepID=A0AAV3U001_9ALTE
MFGIAPSSFGKTLVSITMLIFLCLAQVSQASLIISPTRIMIADKENSAEVTLLNNSTETKTYRIELENKIQDSNGKYISISATASYPGNSAVDYIRFSPRVVTIEPGKYQKIKLRARLPESVLEGEYRAHLAMKSIGAVDVPAGDSVGEGLHTKVLPRMSFSIPVIIRKGEAEMETKIKSVELIPNTLSKPNLDIVVERMGNASSFGVINAYMKSPQTGQIQHIGKLNNVAVYTEREYRHVNLPLWINRVPNNAIIQVVYHGDEEFKGQTLGQAAFRYNK